MHPQQMSHPVSGKEVVGFLQPMLVDLIALVLSAKQAQWHAYGRQLTAIDERLERLVSAAGRAADEVARRMVTLGMPVDGRLGTVATTTSLPELATGLAGEDKAVGAIIGQIDATVARARNALGPLERIDEVSHQILARVLEGLEKFRWEFFVEIAAEPASTVDEAPSTNHAGGHVPSPTAGSPSSPRHDATDWAFRR